MPTPALPPGLVEALRWDGRHPADDALADLAELLAAAGDPRAPLVLPGNFLLGSLLAVPACPHCGRPDHVFWAASGCVVLWGCERPAPGSALGCRCGWSGPAGELLAPLGAG